MWDRVLTGVAALAVLSAPAAGSPPKVSEIAAHLGFSAEETRRLRDDEVVARRLEGESEVSQKELAVTVAMLVREPLENVYQAIRRGDTLEVDRDVLEFRSLGDGSRPDLAGLGFARGEGEEVAGLLRVEGGSEFNLDGPEIARFRALESRGPRTSSAARRAVNEELRAILIERVEAYRRGGARAIAPYDRGGRQSQPGRELAGAATDHVLLPGRADEFFQALADYPNRSPESIEHRFYWIKQVVQDRPNFVLVHRLFQLEADYALIAERQFYVSHSYNSLQIIVGCVPVEDGTLIFYTNRTFTDGVTGLAGRLKRSVGRNRMRERLVEHFEALKRWSVAND